MLGPGGAAITESWRRRRSAAPSRRRSRTRPRPERRRHASGSFHHNQGQGHTAYVSREDCAAVAAAWLAGGAEHAGRTYDVTGPKLLGADDLARVYATAGGSPVAAQGLDDEAFTAGLLAAGLPPEVGGLLTSFGAAIRGGHLDQRSTAVQELTGRPTRTVAEVLADAL